MNERIKWVLPSELLEELLAVGDVYFVGGTVRDHLLGIQRQDQDILVVGVPPEQLLDILRRYGYAEQVGKSFSVIKFHWRGEIFDVALPARRTPEGAVYDPSMSVEDDLKSRDFTANAVGYHLRTCRFVDPLGGIEDIKRRVLRATSDEVFRVDPIRVLRMCRFEAKLGFDVEPHTFELARSAAPQLASVPPERVREEMEKIMLLPKPSVALRCMVNVGAADVILPELVECVGVTQPGSLHSYDVFEHLMRTVDYSPPDLMVRFAALFHDITKPRHRFVDETGRARFFNHHITAAKLARRWLTRYTFSKKFADKVATLVRYHMYTHAATEKGIRRFIRKVGEELIEPLFQLRFADTRAQGPAGDLPAEERFAEKVRKILAQKPPLSVKDLEVNGHDVMEILGIPPGPKVGEVLEYLLSAVLDDPRKNRREILLQMIKEYAQKNFREGE